MKTKTPRRTAAATLLAIFAVLLPASVPLADEPSPPVELDDAITSVTVYSDQAAVTRSASVRLGAGRHQVAFDPLPADARPETAQVEAEGADILAVELLPPWPVDLGDAWTKAQAAQNELVRKLADLQPRYEALRQEAGLLTTFGRQPVRKEGELGSALLATTSNEPVGRWQQARLDELASEAEALRVTARSLRDQLDELQRSIAPAADDGRIRIVATLSLTRATTVKLRATTRISGPRWVPDYDLHLDPEAGVGRVSVNALVSQATGEDWAGIPLRLSTATPGAAASLPQLTAWYLEEQKPPAPEPEMAYDEMVMEDMEEERPRREAKKQKSSASRRSRRSQAPASAPPAESAAYGRGSGGLSTGAIRRGDSGGYSQPAPVTAYEPPPPPPPSGDLIARLLGPPPNGQRIISPPAINVPAPSGPNMNWSRFNPARQAGGFDYAMQSAGPVDIPTDGVARRIPLLTLELAARFEHRVPSAVEEAAYLYALLKQDGQAPLLSGKARVFQSGDLLGTTTLPKAARGATFEIPLGKDEQIRVERKVEEVADRSGPIAGGESLTRTVTLKLRNLRPDAITAVVTDRVPVTYEDGMKVTVTQEPDPATKVKSNGLIRWTVQLAAGADQTLTFAYLIRHPRNSALREQ
jgi:hypothetical protein